MSSMTSTLSCEALGEVGHEESGPPVGTECLFLAWEIGFLVVKTVLLELFGQMF